VASIAGASVPLSRAADGLHHARVPIGGEGPWPLTWAGATPRDHVVALRLRG